MELPEKLNHAEGKAFLVELQPLLEVDRPRIVLDCSQMQNIDSAGIEILLHCMEETMKRDGDLKLAALSPASAAILELMRVDRLFEVFATADEEEELPGGCIARRTADFALVFSSVWDRGSEGCQLNSFSVRRR
jgi:anti-sigma B factor antagonist